MSKRILSWILFALALAAIMHPWFSTPAPLTVTSENVPEINYIWLVRDLIEQGHAFTPWQPKCTGGEAVISHYMYPGYWLMASFSWLTQIPPETIYKWLVYLGTLLSCMAMYEFLLRLTGQPEAGLVAGLIFGLMPGTMASTEGFAIKVSWLIVPVIFWFYERGFGQRLQPDLKGIVGLGLAIGMMFIAANQIPIMISFLLPPYVLLREWQILTHKTSAQTNHPFTLKATSESSEGSLGSKLWLPLLTWLKIRGPAWLITGSVTLGLGAHYYIPALIEFDYLSFSRYTDDVSGQTIPLSFLVYMLAARWFPTFSPHNFHQVTWYIGDLALLLALGGLFLRRKTAITLFFTGAALWYLLLLGGDSFAPLPNVVFWAVDQLPIIRTTLRHSFRLIMPFSFCLAVVSGFGAAGLVDRYKVLSRGVWTTGLMLMLTGLFVLDYFSLQATFRAASGYLRPAEIAAFAWLDRQEANYRYFVPFAQGTNRTYEITYAHHLNRQPAVWDDLYCTDTITRRAYTFVDVLNRQFTILTPYGLDPVVLQMLNLGAVRYIVLTLDSTNHWQFFQVGMFLMDAPVVFEQDQVRILLNRKAKPFMQLYPHTALYPGKATDKRSIMDWLPLLAPRGIALLEGVNPDTVVELNNLVDYLLVDSEVDVDTLSPFDRTRALWPEKALNLPLQSAANHPLEWERPAPDRAEVRLHLNQPASLVFAEAWHPGWHVYVNGVEQSLLRANYVFQGVYLPATGQYEVVFEYTPPIYVWIAGFISGITLLLVLAILVKK